MIIGFPSTFTKALSAPPIREALPPERMASVMEFFMAGLEEKFTQTFAGNYWLVARAVNNC